MQEEMSLIVKVDELEELEKLAGLNYSPSEIAMYLDLPEDEFLKEYNQKGSKIRYHYDRGILIARAQIDMQTQESAKGGNITAAQRLDKIRNRQQFELLKKEMINGES